MKHSLEEFSKIVKDSRSVSQALKTLGLTPSGNAYRVFHKNVKEHNIDISHFSGQGWLKGTVGVHKSNRKIPLDEILQGLHPDYQSHKLKLRLFSERIFDRCCQKCHLTEWLGEPIPLELEHNDGDCTNNKLDNLSILCPNCHAQTATYAGKNKGKRNMVGKVGLEPTRLSTTHFECAASTDSATTP